jgi:hypothetical protein
MAVIREIAFGDGTVVQITDWGDYPIWSRLVVAAGDLANLGQKQYLFNYTEGGLVPMTNQRATKSDTNMPAQSQLPMGHQMLVYSMQVIPDEFATDSYPLRMNPEVTVTVAYWKWRNIFFHTMATLRVEQTKAFVEGRLDHFPMGGGFQLDHNAYMAAGNAQGYQITNGVKAWSATRRLAVPVHLGSLENFAVEVEWPRGGVNNSQTDYGFTYGFGLMFRLTGPRQRPTA